MLLGKDLCGRHQSRLDAVFRRQIRSRGSHSGLAAAHVALEHPVHHPAGAKVAADIRKRPLLRAREREGQRRAEGRKVQICKGLPALLRPAAPHQPEAQGEDEELFKDQTVSCLLERFKAGGLVDVCIGEGRVTQAVLPAQGKRQQLRQAVAAQGKRLRDRAGDKVVVEARGETVNGHDAPGENAGLLHVLKDGVCHAVAGVVPGERAVEIILLAVLQVVRGIFLVEEGEPQPRTLVGDRNFGEIQALADMVGLRVRGDHGAEAGRLVHLKLADRHKARPVFIGPGKIGNQIIDRLDAERRKLLGSGLADALEIPHGRI